MSKGRSEALVSSRKVFPCVCESEKAVLRSSAHNGSALINLGTTSGKYPRRPVRPGLIAIWQL